MSGALDRPEENLLTALLMVQIEMPSLQRDKINPHFRSQYISLDALMAAVTPVLTKFKLVWITFPTYDEDGRPILRYEMHHVPSEEKLHGGMLLLPDRAGPQAQGSAITYARRYSLMAVLGLVADEDDDANKATSPPPTQIQARTKAQQLTIEDHDPTPLLDPDQLKRLVDSIRAKSDDPEYTKLMLSSVGKSHLTELTNRDARRIAKLLVQ